MNGKTAKMLRAHIGNPGQTKYEVMPGTQRRKFAETDPMNLGGGVKTCTIQLDQTCGRKRYKALKRRYQSARAGEMFGTLAWPESL